MSREVVWTKAVVDAFVDEACLSEEEELIIRSRAKGWTRTKQSMQYNMSIRKIDYIIHTLKTKYDEAQKYSEILPKRNIKKSGTLCPGLFFISQFLILCLLPHDFRQKPSSHFHYFVLFFRINAQFPIAVQR